MQQVEDDKLSSYLYRLMVNKMILEYQSKREKQRINRHDETSERGRKLREHSKSKPDDFHAKYEHMMGGSDR